MIADELDRKCSVDMEATLATHGTLDGFLLAFARIEQNGDGRKFRPGADLRPVRAPRRRIVHIDIQQFCHSYTLHSSRDSLYTFGKCAIYS